MLFLARSTNEREIISKINKLINFCYNEHDLRFPRTQSPCTSTLHTKFLTVFHHPCRIGGLCAKKTLKTEVNKIELEKKIYKKMSYK